MKRPTFIVGGALVGTTQCIDNWVAEVHPLSG
jgi:hypothetical protein